MRIRSLILAVCVISAAPMAFADMASANDAFRAGRYDAALEEAVAIAEIVLVSQSTVGFQAG